jgi:hypothetical protein
MPQQEKISCKSDSEKLLLVEGPNDCHAVFQLMRLIYQGDPVFGLHECGGDEGVLDSLGFRLVNPRPRQKILGLILDTDIEGAGHEEVVQRRLDQLRARTGNYYQLPDVFPEEGVIVEPLLDRPDSVRQPKLGIWLMPNNRAYGMFEDLLAGSLPEKEKRYTAAVVDKAKEDGIATFKQVHISKAVIRTYMAWQDPPDIQYLGLAIKRGTFNNIEATCTRFIEWIERLFDVPSRQ